MKAIRLMKDIKRSYYNYLNTVYGDMIHAWNVGLWMENIVSRDLEVKSTESCVWIDIIDK
jgi:hypothetical protein